MKEVLNLCKEMHLLPQVKQYFKANLHTHTKLSDGWLTPEEVKEAYKALGYQILCFTDHNIIIDHSNMNEPNFLMLTGAELNIDASDMSKINTKTYHLNLIAKEANNLWCPAKLHRWFSIAEEYDDAVEYDNMNLQYSTDSINELIKKATEKGFLVMYNHPTWSCQSYPDYSPLKGLWGMELRNTECCLLGNNENNFRVYKDLLMLGNRVFPLGADDMHTPNALGRSWIMVGASDLSYGSVIDALENGDFYMSCGPEITNLFVENNTLKITCSDAQRINIETNGRLAKAFFAENAPIREVEFPLDNFLSKTDGDGNAFIYITITAPDGTYAVTRAYYQNELI